MYLEEFEAWVLMMNKLILIYILLFLSYNKVEAGDCFLNKRIVSTVEIIDGGKLCQIFGKKQDGVFLLKIIFDERHPPKKVSFSIRKDSMNKTLETPVYYMQNKDGSYFVTFKLDKCNTQDLSFRVDLTFDFYGKKRETSTGIYLSCIRPEEKSVKSRSLSPI